MKKLIAMALVAAVMVVGTAGTAFARKTGNPTNPGHSQNPNPGK